MDCAATLDSWSVLIHWFTFALYAIHVCSFFLWGCCSLAQIWPDYISSPKNYMCTNSRMQIREMTVSYQRCMSCAIACKWRALGMHSHSSPLSHWLPRMRRWNASVNSHSCLSWMGNNLISHSLRQLHLPFHYIMQLVLNALKPQLLVSTCISACFAQSAICTLPLSN